MSHYLPSNLVFWHPDESTQHGSLFFLGHCYKQCKKLSQEMEIMSCATCDKPLIDEFKASIGPSYSFE